MSRAGYILAGAVLLGAAVWLGWRSHAAAKWSASVPWPSAVAAPSGPWTEPLRAAHAEAARWPVRREAVERLARLYLANGFPAEAAALLPGIIARRPEAPEWRHRRASLLAAEGRLAEAVAQWQELQAAGLASRAARVWLAGALAMLNRRAEAEAVFRGLLAEQPGDPYAWHGLVLLDLQEQRWPEARAKLRTALAAAPDFYGHHALLGTVARHDGDEAAAAEADRNVKRLGRFRDVPDPWLEPALEDCFNPYLLRVDADRIRAEAGPDDHAGLAGALARLDRAIALDPTDAMNYQLLATIQGIRGDTGAARRAYERGLELDPGAVTMYLRLANLLGRLGEGEALHDLLVRAVRRCPGDPDLASRLAEACAGSGRWREAADAYRHLQALRPDRPELAPQAALAEFRAGDEGAGLALLRENLRRFPEHEETLGYLLLNAVHRGDETEAGALLRRLGTVAPGTRATTEMQRIVRERFGAPPPKVAR